MEIVAEVTTSISAGMEKSPEQWGTAIRQTLEDHMLSSRGQAMATVIAMTAIGPFVSEVGRAQLLAQAEIMGVIPREE